MIRNPHRSELNSGPELTPLIDIVFIVVVFLLLTANTPMLSLSVDIPNTDSKIDHATQPKSSITITLNGESPHWHLAFSEGVSTSPAAAQEQVEQYADWDSFKVALLTRVKQQPSALLIAPSSNTNAELLLQLLALLNEQQLTDAQILMEPEQ